MADRRAWFKRATGCLGALVLLYLTIWLAVPPLLKWQIEAQRDALGRELRVGRVAFTPWKLDIVVEDLQIAGAKAPLEATQPLLSVARMHVDFAVSSLFRLAPVIQAFEVDGLRLRVSRLAPGRYDVDDLLQRLATPKSSGSSDAPPVHFAVYNVQLRDAAIRFEDLPSAKVHQLTALHLAVPFLSNLPAQVDVKVEPHLSFLLNGAPFDSGASATPFAKTRSGELTFKVTDLNLAPYLGYLPDSLPVRVSAGTVSADLAMRFALPDGTPPTLTLRGTLGIHEAQLTDTGGAPWLAWKRLDADLREVAPLARRFSLSSARADGVRLTARRDADGRFNLPGLDAVSSTPTAAPRQPVAAASSAAPTAAAQAGPTAGGWQVELDRFELTDAAVAWSDAAVRPAAALRLDDLSIDVQGVRWPMTRPIGLAARGRVRTAAPASEAGTFTIDGSATNHEAALTGSLASLPIDALGAYLAQVLTPKVDGRLSAQLRLDWSDGQAGPSRLGVVLNTATIDGLALQERPVRGDAQAPQTLASMKQLRVTQAQIDVPGREVTIDRLSLDQPSLALARSQDGQFDIGRWLVAPPAAPVPSAARPAPPASAAVPWRVNVGNASLTDGRLLFADAHAAGAGAAHPLRVAVDDLRVSVQNLAWQGDRPTVPAQIELGGRLGPPRAPGEPRAAGAFDWRGVVGVAPLLLTGSLKVERLPAHLFMPYLGAELGLRVARAELGYVGNLSVRQLPSGWDVDAGADLLLGAVRLESVPRPSTAGPGETLLSWNTFGLKGAQLSIKPGAKPRVEVAQAALGDFYTRLAITEEGKLNFSDVASSPSAPAAPAGAASASSELPIDLRLGETTLTQGRIDFSDHYVRPNYSAALTELNGRLGALRSGSGEMAALSLKGKAAGTALLDISGHVNPIARPLALDIHAKATDLELAPLSPYAAKYAGYAIERGKLSMDVAYRLEPDGQLDAKNQVVLNQLTFGAKVESPTATRLPVLLAVALLKDRNGVIDLDLPISGSLNDPQFSVAGIVGRMLLNLLAKAITSPFALLTGGAGGGGATGDPGQVEFVPGTSRLSAAGVAAVATVAQGLAGKPGLVLTVTGAADPRSEDEAYRSAALDERLAAVRQKETVASAAAASAPAPPLGTEARARLVKQLYQDTDLPDKPRNVFGIARDVPAAEMEARLKASIAVDADAMRELALQRGVGVRDALIAKGLAADRLFLAAPQLRSPEPAEAAAWVPQARLSVSVN